MLESLYPPPSYENFKCGEIFCVSPPGVFHVTCTSCDQKIHFDEFVTHYQILHLTLAEKTISLDDLVREPNTKVEKGLVSEDIGIKQEDDPIKQEDYNDKPANIDIGDKLELDVSRDDDESGEKEEYDEDDICLQELINGPTRISKRKKAVTRKPLTRSAKKAKVKKVVDNDDKKNELETVFLTNGNDIHLSLEEPCLNEQETVDNPADHNADQDADHDADNDGDHDDDNDTDDDYWPDETQDKAKNNESEADKKEELPFKCAICSRSYSSKKTLRKHIYNTHNPNKPKRKPPPNKIQHKCDICQEVFRTAPVLKAHQYKHTGIFCDICGKPFKQVGSMMTHKIRHTGVKEHKCKECPKEFFTAKELKSHMICHTGMQVVCEICGKRCRDGAVLAIHMRRHTGERPAKCNVCGKSFFTTYDLNVHAVAHSSERPFPCDVCGSRFQRKKALRIHKRIHSKERNHECKLCGKGFTLASGLSSHMRSHDAALEKSNAELATSVFIPTVFIGNPYLNVDSQEASGASMSSPTTEITDANAEEVQLLAAYIV